MGKCPRKIALFISSTLLVIIIVWSGWEIKQVESQYRRNTCIFNIGWIWSMPYDLSNTLRAPLAGPLSLILTAGLGVIMFFGLIVSPVYYLLGTPTRKYHLNDAIQTFPYPVRKRRSAFDDDAFDLSSLNKTYAMISMDHPPMFNINSTEEKISEPTPSRHHPNFVDSIFFFLPEDDENCKKLLLCHSHGYLVHLPTFVLPVYRFFSRKYMMIPEEYQRSVQIGFQDQGNCANVYQNCSKDLVTIVGETVSHLFFLDEDYGGDSGLPSAFSFMNEIVSLF